MPLKRGSLQPGDTGRGTQNPFGGPPDGFFVALRCPMTSAKRGFTTSILHSDRDAPVEHGALHKPLHTSVAYGYSDARDLAAVFQGKAAGYAYGRHGNPTPAAREAKLTWREDGAATACFATGMAAIAAALLALLKAGDHVVASHFLFGN